MRLNLTLDASAPLRVRVVADDPLVRHAIPALLREAGARVVEADGDAADVALVAGPGVEDVDAPAVALVADADAARRARRLGAMGVLARDARPDTLLAALQAVATGLAVSDDAFTLAAARPPAADVEALTPRETDVLALLVEGLPNKLVADHLGITERTARYHVAQILAKLDAQSRTEAVVTAARLGLVSL